MLCIKVSFWNIGYQWRWSGIGESPYSRKSYKHVHEAITIREVAVVCGFSWLAENMINEPGQGIR